MLSSWWQTTLHYEMPSLSGTLWVPLTTFASIAWNMALESSFRPSSLGNIVEVLATQPKFLQPSGFCTVINYATTFCTTNVFGFFCGVMAHFKLIKRYCTPPRSPELEPHHQMQFSFILRAYTLVSIRYELLSPKSNYDIQYIFTYATFWDLNWNLLQMEIVDIPVCPGLVLANHLYTPSLYSIHDVIKY